jgi:hypothetical protein
LDLKKNLPGYAFTSISSVPLKTALGVIKTGPYERNDMQYDSKIAS